MTIQFRDVLQAVDGPHRGLIAQVVALNNGEVELLTRSYEGVPTTFKVAPGDLQAWKPTGGKALVGPSKVPGATSVPQQAESLAPLKIEELLEPLPAAVKAVPMNSVPEPDTSAWNVEEPAPVSNGKRNYTALVTNGAGAKATIPFSLRAGLDPARHKGPIVIKAKGVLPDVKPFTVTEIHEAP